MSSSLLQIVKRRKFVLGAAAIVVLLFIVVAGKQYDSAEGSVKLADSFTVREGPLTISLAEAGTISPDDLKLFQFVDTAEEAVRIIDAYDPKDCE